MLWSHSGFGARAPDASHTESGELPRSSRRSLNHYVQMSDYKTHHSRAWHKRAKLKAHSFQKVRKGNIGQYFHKWLQATRQRQAAQAPAPLVPQPKGAFSRTRRPKLFSVQSRKNSYKKYGIKFKRVKKPAWFIKRKYKLRTKHTLRRRR